MAERIRGGSRVRGRFPVSINGVVYYLLVDGEFNGSQDLRHALLNAGIEIVEDNFGNVTGQYIIHPTLYGSRISVSVNGRMRYYKTGVPVSFSVEVLATIINSALVFYPEGGKPSPGGGAPPAPPSPPSPPAPPAPSPPPVVVLADILTEDGGQLLTEDGSLLIQEG